MVSNESCAEVNVSPKNKIRHFKNVELVSCVEYVHINLSAEVELKKRVAATVTNSNQRRRKKI